MDIVPFASALIAILIPVALIARVVLVIRHANGAEALPGIGTTRRLFLYGLAFLSLMLAAIGVTVLAASTLDGLFHRSIGRGGNNAQAAFGLAAVIANFPVWLLLMRAGSKSLVTYPGEAGTLGRNFYTYSVMLISATVVAFTTARTLSDLLSLGNVNTSQLAALIIWAGVWYFHWRTEAAEGQPTLVAVTIKRLYVYITSAYSLVMLAVGASFLLYGLLDDAYSALFTATIVGFGAADIWSDGVRTSLSVALVGGAWWWFHWHRATDNDHASELRIASVYVLGIFGGLVVTVSGISIAVYTILQWAIVERFGAPMSEFFHTFPAAISVTTAGVALWKYHRITSQLDAAEDLERSNSGNRVYSYLSAAVGLVTMAVGISVLIGVIVGLLSTASTSVIVGSRWWGTPLAAAFTSIIVGAPIWVHEWIQRRAAAIAQNPAERSMLARRAYMFSVFGVAVLATLITASVILFNILRAALDGNLRAESFFDVRWGFGVVAAAALVSAYHWQIMKEDRALEPKIVPAPDASPKQVTAVASSAARAAITQITSQVNAKVAHWERRDDAGVPQLTAKQTSNLASAISNTPSEHVLLIADASGIQFIPL